MQHQAQEVQLLELAEVIEDALRDAHTLVQRLSLYALERQAVRQMDRNGIGSVRALRSLAEYRQERERLARGTDEP